MNLHEVAATGSRKKIRELVQGGADVNALSAEDRTPLDVAIAAGNADVATALEWSGGLTGEEAMTPIRRRRGLGCLRIEPDSWTRVGFELESPDSAAFDGLVDAAERWLSVNRIEREVEGELRGGSLPAPEEHWSLLVKLEGQRWVQALNLQDNAAAVASQSAGRRRIDTGYQDTAGVTFFGLKLNGEDQVGFGTMGIGFGESEDPSEGDHEDWEKTSFTHSSHPPDWWKQFASGDEVIDALAADADAYLPMLYASAEGGLIRLHGMPADVVPAIERAALLVGAAPRARRQAKSM